MPRLPLIAALALPLATLACAPGGPAPALATTEPVPPATQQAGIPAATDTAAAQPACVANPDYSRKPVAGRSGSSVAWVARPEGDGCHWVRTRV